MRLGAEGAQLVITVDCGAMAHEALAMARAAGVEVMVVDHHKCADELPVAVALVNPNRLDESDEGASFGHLAAVGMAFLLAVATVRTLRARGAFKGCAEPDLLSLLDLVALGTVADVVTSGPYRRSSSRPRRMVSSASDLSPSVSLMAGVRRRLAGHRPCG